MKTWLEIPWEKRVEKAVKNKKFDPSDLRLSELWITNPISELSDTLEFREGQLYLGPVDMQMVLDGIYFTKAIEENDIGLAVNCMKSMNERVLKLHGYEPWPKVKNFKVKITDVKE
jgi:hypothetical protein